MANTSQTAAGFAIIAALIALTGTALAALDVAMGFVLTLISLALVALVVAAALIAAERGAGLPSVLARLSAMRRPRPRP